MAAFLKGKEDVKRYNCKCCICRNNCLLQICIRKIEVEKDLSKSDRFTKGKHKVLRIFIVTVHELYRPNFKWYSLCITVHLRRYRRILHF